MSDLEELQRVAKEKYEALMSIQWSRHKMESELEEEVRKKVKEKFGEAERKASKEHGEADCALKTELERIRVAESESKIPFPVGTKMVLWERERFSDGWRTPCVFGILEVFKKGDAYPVNLRWNAPTPGDIIVRILTKDGKPGIKTEKYSVWRNKAWVPEGQRPKEKE